MVSEKKRAANRENAKKSTGPRTDEGKRRSAMNAVRHGLCARTVCVHGEQSADFNALVSELVREHRPRSSTEFALVYRIAVASWNMRRLTEAETSIIDAATLAKAYENGKWLEKRIDIGEAMLKAMKDDKRFNALQLYQQRFERAFYRALAELRHVRKERENRPDEEDDESASATILSGRAPDESEPETPPAPQPDIHAHPPTDATDSGCRQRAHDAAASTDIASAAAATSATNTLGAPNVSCAPNATATTSAAPLCGEVVERDRYDTEGSGSGAAAGSFEQTNPPTPPQAVVSNALAPKASEPNEPTPQHDGTVATDPKPTDGKPKSWPLSMVSTVIRSSVVWPIPPGPYDARDYYKLPPMIRSSIAIAARAQRGGADPRADGVTPRSRWRGSL